MAASTDLRKEREAWLALWCNITTPSVCMKKLATVAKKQTSCHQQHSPIMFILSIQNKGPIINFQPGILARPHHSGAFSTKSTHAMNLRIRTTPSYAGQPTAASSVSVIIMPPASGPRRRSSTFPSSGTIDSRGPRRHVVTRRRRRVIDRGRGRRIITRRITEEYAQSRNNKPQRRPIIRPCGDWCAGQAASEHHTAGKRQPAWTDSECQWLNHKKLLVVVKRIHCKQASAKDRMPASR